VSSGPIRPLAPEDLRFVPEPPEFETLAAQHLGSLGTDQDGFDSVFNDAFSLTGTATAALASFDPDLTDASTVAPEFDNTEGANLAADLQPASDAADAALEEFNLAVPPVPDSGTSSGSGDGSTGGGGSVSTASFTADEFPGTQCTGPIDTIQTIRVGATPWVEHIPLSVTGARQYQLLSAVMESGDPAIFSVQMSIDTFDRQVLNDAVEVIVHPVKSGRFTCVAHLTYAGGLADNRLCFGVAILP
jgi:hypothetical protein